MSVPSSPFHQRLKVGVLGAVVCLIALLPWWRNHGFLRDFYDYGLFINVNARLAEGQRPYTDFTTPAQTAAFVFNYAAESAWGGTYLGMTRGAAALIILGGLSLTFILARRFNPWVAALLALAIVAGSASQHTILFYNPLGVFAMALVVWSFAVAPVLRRETLGWHLLAAAGLLLGGVNKINFHLLACAMAAGWVIHAWLLRKAARPRVLLTFAFIALFGLVLPVSLEIAWTGAGWHGWFYNIVQLPLSARGGRISQLFSPELYLNTVHGYYGTLRIPQVGLIGVLMPLVAIAVALRTPVDGPNGWRRLCLVLAGLLAAFASSALLLTNNEIAYVTFAAALVVSVGLWLGFGLRPRGAGFMAGLLLPAVLLAAAGWESAWQGQRSQFGHDRSPRDEYARGEEAGAEFQYLQGLRVPRPLTDSLRDLARWRQALPGDDATRVFYGPGLEWLEHVWPARKVTGLPLIAAAFDGQRENKLLEREVIRSDAFRHMVAMEAWDHWNASVQDIMARTMMKQRITTGIMAYRKLPPGTVSARPIDFLFGGLGSNVDGLRIITPMPMPGLSDGRRYLGIDRGEGRIEVNTPCRRMSAEYVLERIGSDSPGPLIAHLAVYANMSGAMLPRWSADIPLPDGKNELVVAIDPVDGSGLPLTFTVTVPGVAAGSLRAGWRAFHLSDTVDSDAVAPMLQSGVDPLMNAGEAVRRSALPDELRRAPTFIRRALVEDDALLLPAGGELWVKLEGLYTDIPITVRSKDPRTDPKPTVHAVYYKGGRLERFVPNFDPTNGSVRFKAWSPENGGWIGILADPDAGSAALAVKIGSTGTR